MTQMKRSRRLQAGLAGLSVVSALGAAVGLGLTTHTHSSQSASGTNTGTGGATSTRSRGEGDDGTTRQTQTRRSQSSHRSTAQGPVSQPANTAPQVTTSGS